MNRLKEIWMYVESGVGGAFRRYRWNLEWMEWVEGMERCGLSGGVSVRPLIHA